MKEQVEWEKTGYVGLARRMTGHFRTIAPTLRHEFRACEEPASVTWKTKIPNEYGEAITHSGRFSDVEGEDTLVVVLHGLGGSVTRGYCLEAAIASNRQGLPTLRLALRGADGLGRDFHHAGFIEDLGPLLKKAPFDRLRRSHWSVFHWGGM